jgi:hypothetical protein
MNGTLTVFDVTGGEVPAEAVTETVPTTALLRITVALPLTVVALAAESVPLPLWIEKLTGVPLGTVPLTVSTGTTVAFKETGPLLLIEPVVGIAARPIEPGLLGLLNEVVTLPVAGAAVAVTVTLPSTVLLSVTEALPLALVSELTDDSVPVPEVTANETIVPAGTGPPATF